MKNIDWSEITDNNEVIELLKERNRIEEQILAIDRLALINYELQTLSIKKTKENKSGIDWEQRRMIDFDYT